MATPVAQTTSNQYENCSQTFLRLSHSTYYVVLQLLFISLAICMASRYSLHLQFIFVISLLTEVQLCGCRGADYEWLMLSRRRKVNFCHCVMFSYASIFVTLSSARKRIQTTRCIPRLDGRISTFGQIHTIYWRYNVRLYLLESTFKWKLRCNWIRWVVCYHSSRSSIIIQIRLFTKTYYSTCPVESWRAQNRIRSYPNSWFTGSCGHGRFPLGEILTDDENNRTENSSRLSFEP